MPYYGEEMPKNMNQLARAISMWEGGKQEMSIAQIKEVLAILSDYMAEDPLQIMELLVKNAKKRGG